MKIYNFFVVLFLVSVAFVATMQIEGSSEWYFVLLYIFLVLFIHEIGHAISIILTRAGKIMRLVVNRKGVGIQWYCKDWNPIKLAIISLSGPFANIAAGLLLYISGEKFLALNSAFFGSFCLLYHSPAGDGYRSFQHLKKYFKETEKGSVS